MKEGPGDGREAHGNCSEGELGEADLEGGREGGERKDRELDVDSRVCNEEGEGN